MSYDSNDKALEWLKTMVAADGALTEDEKALVAKQARDMEEAMMPYVRTAPVSMPPRTIKRKAPHHKHPSNYTPPKRKNR